MKHYIRIIDEDFNELLMDTDLKKTYKVNFKKKYGTNDWKKSLKTGLLFCLLGILILSYYNLSILYGLIPLVLGFVYKYYADIDYVKEVEEE